MRVLVGTLVLASMFVAEALYQRRQERIRQALAAWKALAVALKPGLDAMAAATRAASLTFDQMVDALRSVLFVDPPDEHTSNGDELRRLDQVLEEHRLRIRALGGFVEGES